MTPLELTLIGFVPALALVFGAGRIVESIRNGRYVRKDMCIRIHEDQDRRLVVMESILTHIQSWMEKHK